MPKKRQRTLVKTPPPPSESTEGPKATADRPPLADSAPTVRPSPTSGYAFSPASLWPKGVSANPGGVPRGKRISTRVMEMMTWKRADLEALVQDTEAEARDHIAAKMLLRAMKNDDANADTNTVLDRTEGKVLQELNVRAGVAPILTDEQLAGIASGTLDPASIVDLGPRVNEIRSDRG